MTPDESAFYSQYNGQFYIAGTEVILLLCPGDKKVGYTPDFSGFSR